MQDTDHIKVKSWKEFKDSKVLWFVNRTIHLFGWAIILKYDDNKNIIGAFPARVDYRGFGEESDTKGYIGLTEYLKNNIDDLSKEANSGL